MAEISNIEWTDSTFNPWEGCQKAGPGCDHCYAENRNARFGGGTAVNWGPGAPRRRTSAANWRKPAQWNARSFYECTCCGWRGDETDSEFHTPRKGCIHDLVPARRRVFCASLADVFDNAVDPQWREDLFALILATPHLDWLLLTKRIGNVHNMIGESLIHLAVQQGMGPTDLMAAWPWPNVWLGATVVNQAEADRDIPKLLAVPARVRFLSMEPLLGPVELGLQCENWSDDIVMDPETGAYECCKACDFTGIGNAIDWVITGGESGPNARPMHPDWFRSLRDQCAAAGVPFLFKQWGEFLPADANEADPAVADVPDSRLFWSDGSKWDRFDGQRAGVALVARVGKKAAGRLLDDRTHDGFPAHPTRGMT